MNKILSAAAFLLAVIPVAAQNKAAFKYDVNFDYDFDNREFDSGDELYTDSYTINAARLTPSAGISFKQNGALTHNVMLGVDLLKNMGETPRNRSERSLENWDLIREMTLWYNIEATLDNAAVKGWAGMFPRRFSVFGTPDTPQESVPGRNIPSVFLSDSYRFYDNNIEGILLTAQRSNAYYEVALDWLGMYGSKRREQFKVHSYGKGKVLDWLGLGWAAEAHHYANAIEYGHVIDNFLLSPFIEFDINEISGSELQTLALSFNWLSSLHRDRGTESGLHSSNGGQLTLDVRNWDAGIRNEAYFGNNLMPYYDVHSPEGAIYGTDLYHGNPFYRVSGIKDGGEKCGLYDRLEVYWQPQIASFLDFRISAVMHFADDGFQGWQQKIGLVFNLEKALKNDGKREGRRNRQDWLQEPRLFEKFL